MLTKKYASLLMVFAFLAAPLAVSAQVGAASGSYKFYLEDRLLKSLEFSASTDERGTTTGFMQFSDEAKVVFQDVDGTGEPPKDEEVAFSMKADLDSMTIEKNRAIISGVIRDSSLRSYIGKWVQLVIEDNDGVETPDKFVWSLCTPEIGGWIPTDAERKDDDGAFMSWWATDAERRNDVGIPSPSVMPGMLKACKANPIQSYEFADILKGDGVITIR